MRKRWTRLVLIVCLVLLVSTLGCCVAAVQYGWPLARLVATAAGFAGLAALLQLDVAGLFDRLIEAHSSEEDFPYGPPSHVTRDLMAIDNPDEPLRSLIRRALFTDTRTGYWLGLSSIALGTLAAWV